MNTFFVFTENFKTTIETYDGKLVMTFTSEFAHLANSICAKLNEDELIDNEMASYYAENLQS